MPCASLRLDRKDGRRQTVKTARAGTAAEGLRHDDLRKRKAPEGRAGAPLPGVHECWVVGYARRSCHDVRRVLCAAFQNRPI